MKPKTPSVGCRREAACPVAPCSGGSGRRIPRLSPGMTGRLATGLLGMAPALFAAASAHAAGPLPTPCTACNTNTGVQGFIQKGAQTNLQAPAIVPNTGVTPGPAPGTTYSSNGTVLNIYQKSPTAILNWQDFNIDPGHTVNFVQPGATASALNRIWDANPSVIAGNLNANGQIYLVNQNGIVFANGAQVNVGGLIASSLGITDGIYQNGYLANNNAPGSITPAFAGIGGFVRVDTGATLNGSKIMLFAPVVENSGRISTPDGQTVLAAGHKVYLQASQDPNLRGVLVEVDVANPGTKDANAAANGVQNNGVGTASNLGSVLSQRGNITLVGYAVNQQGVLSATTSVTQNGSIKLLARHEVAPTSSTYNHYNDTPTSNPNYYDIRATQTGVVTLGRNSVTAVAPESADNATTTDGQGFKPSIVEAMGRTVDVAGSIVAPGGKVNLVAVGNLDSTVGLLGSANNVYQAVNSANPYSSFLNPNYIPVAETPARNPDGSAVPPSRVFLENGSLVDVSGSSASVSVARNILSVQLRGAQLADAPMQKNGFLWGRNVNVDIRKGTALANIAGDEAQIGRAAAERTSSGGQVLIASSGDVVLNPGSTINISGGQVNYTGAYIDSTTLISRGMAYDIANASPSLIYDGIGGSSPVWDPGYTQGMAAGSVAIVAPNAALGGRIVAGTVAGSYQRQPYADPSTLAANSYKNTWQMLPKGGSLTIGAANAVPDPSNVYDFATNGNVVVQSNPQQSSYAIDAVNLPSFIAVDAGLFSSNLNNLAVYTNGVIGVAPGVPLDLAPGGSVKLLGGQVNLLGSISVPGGSVSLGTVKTTLYSNAGGIIAAGNISTRGTWVNDSQVLGPADFSKPIVANGGSISVNSGGDLNIASRSVLDASGGGWVDQAGKAHGGNGGKVSLSGATVQSLDQVALQSYGVQTGKGGALSISTKSQDVTLGGTGSGLRLSSSFFQSGGFSSYSISGAANVTVSRNAAISPKSRSLILNPDAALQPSGSDVYGFSTAGFLPDWQRNPANITLAQTAAGGGALTIDTGSAILVDPKASITLNAANQLTVKGTLDAPAGNINLKLDSSDANYYANQSIWLDNGGKLLAQGYFLRSAPNPGGLVQGQVLSGGAISIAANRGFVYASSGSSMDVSGTSADIDLPQMDSGSPVYAAAHVAGDAGSISVAAAEGAIFDGGMKASVEAGSRAAAGSFSLTLTVSGKYDPTLGYPQTLRQIRVATSGAGNFSANALTAATDPTTKQVTGYSINNSNDGQAFVDQNSLNGFDQVSLALRPGGARNSNDAIVLGDNVALAARRSITLDAPLIDAGANVGLNSAHVTLGNLDTANQAAAAPAAGTGTLNVAAQMVDLSGKFSIGNASSVNISSNGDIRLNGVLDSGASLTAQSLQGALRTRGNVALQANQVYVSTLAQFTVSSEDNSGNPSGAIAVLPNNASNPGSGSSPVLSAGGSLTLSAANIVQNGVLKAPMGTIDLKGSSSVVLAGGSVTSVSAEGQTIPFGLIQGGNTWYYDPLGTGGSLVRIGNLPQKIVKLEGPNITVAKGATVDLSGGGDLLATEFFAGIGGTVDVLDPVQAPANTYAVVPGISGYSPYDPQSAGQYAQNGSKTSLKDGAMVYLAGGNGLKAGYYSLLPASYALLPGAYRVTAVSGHQDLQPGQGALALPDGSQIIAGKFAVAGTGIMDARWSGFAVSPGSIVRTQSEFHDSHANAFFASDRPADAGQLIVDASGGGAALTLDGTFVTQAGSGGRGAWVDLNGPGFDIVNAAGSGTLSGGVELTTATLNGLGAQSLLIGGTRTQTSTGVSISAGASSVVVENGGATLSGPEIILAANSNVSVNSGSGISSNGNYSGAPQNIAVSGDGALLRVSSGGQATVSRSNFTGNQGTLSVANGAAIASANSVLLDAARSTNIGNTASLTGKSFSVAASGIDIGGGTSGPSSLSLSPALLAQIGNFHDITLHSYSDINFYGNAAIGGLDGSGRHLISSLTLNAKSLNGNHAAASVIDASSLTLTNGNGSVVLATPAGSGTLGVNADNIFLSDGASTLQGFDKVSLNAAAITGQGTGSLGLSPGNGSSRSLTLSGTIVGTAKSDQAIAASGYDISILPGAGAPAANGDVGAKLAVTGNSILDKGVISLASGSLTLHASQGLTLDTGSSTSVRGAAKAIAGQSANAPAGSVTLVSDSGNVSVASGASVDVSGNGGDAGTLTVSAARGSVSLAGNLYGSTVSGRQGSFVLDTGSLASVTALDNLLNAGGFSNLVDLRVRSGDVSLDAGSVVKANSFHLAADAGKIGVFGAIDASGANGGDILLAASNDVTLQAGSVLNASGNPASGTGGKVSLETVNGAVNLMNGSSIDVSGQAPGSVLLRAPQTGNGTDVAVDTAAGTSITVKPGANVSVEGYRNYTANTIAAADIANNSAYYQDAMNFAGNAAIIKTRLGNPGIGVLPGIRIGSAGDLTLATNWNLHNWLTAADGSSIPGILTLKAGGNLNFGSGTATASLSDGFVSVSTGNSTDVTLTNDVSWSYRLVAGSDATAANVMAVGGAGNVVLAPGTAAKSGGRGNSTPAKQEIVRTGSGSIDIAAGGGLYLGNKDSVIYTAGRQASNIAANIGGAAKAFTTGGGDINVSVKGDINATAGPAGNNGAVNQLITDWLWRQSSADQSTPTAWWINFGTFSQNIGALGGGNVDISAGGNIRSLSAAVPTTGYVDVKGNTQTLGGGNLSVKAGGNIDSGIFYVGKGQGSLRAGGSMGSSRSDPYYTLYTILALGQGNFDVKTNGDLNLQAVVNPTMIFPGPSQPGGRGTSIGYFSTYGDSSGVSLQSLNGNVLLSNNTGFLQNVSRTTAVTPTDTSPYILYTNSNINVDQGAISVYPGTLNAIALNGCIGVNGSCAIASGSASSMTLFPSPTGNLKLLAGADIYITNTLYMSDISSAAMQPGSPISSYSGANMDNTLQSAHGTAALSQLPLHNGDASPVVIAAAGNINGDNSTVTTPNLTLSKHAQIQAGNDIANLSMSVQNLTNTDTTSLTAGGDISFAPNATSPSSSTPGITVYGPGQLLLQAGRNVDLGQSAGLLTDGNLLNPYLPDAGAGVTVLAGAGSNAAGTQAFIGKYIDPARSATHGTELVNFVNAYASSPVTTAADAYVAFSKMPADLRNAFVTQAFFGELRASGRSAISSGNYSAGYDAVSTLFPGSRQGDVSLYYSQIKTVRGGDINILAPGGGVNAGLANASSSGPQKTAVQLGVVTVKGGNVNAFVNNDFLVNQSRVFTLQGGNILMWSSRGNLDAGKGSKTASSTPPPLLVVDPKTGTFYVDVTQSVVGSGIRVLLASKNVVPGSVDLFAPSGVINAGDAGIGSAGNIYLGALHVVGADNINFGGAAVGVPITTTASVGGLSGVSNFQGAGQAADQVTQNLGKQSDMAQIKDALANFKPLFLSVDVIGIGNETLAP